ncbi:DNA-binding CsgD family transcriptional regulator [Bradyrhizobium ottawaense]|uniref:LuxR C-terminal-related transcriptional regulator n=1 Tax=Bradyrhizobium ottawaense TaxID=931866 RepID=UPI0038332BB7
MSVLETLTGRQRDVCVLVAEGLSNKEVARRLGIGPRTAEFHRLEAYKRLGVCNVAQLVRKILVHA